MSVGSLVDQTSGGDILRVQLETKFPGRPHRSNRLDELLLSSGLLQSVGARREGGLVLFKLSQRLYSCRTDEQQQQQQPLHFG